MSTADGQLLTRCVNHVHLMKETFWQILCDARPLFSILFTANVVFLALLGLSWLFGSRDSEMTTITLLALVPISISFLLSAYVLRRCRT